MGGGAFDVHCARFAWFGAIGQWQGAGGWGAGRWQWSDGNGGVVQQWFAWRWMYIGGGLSERGMRGRSVLQYGLWRGRGLHDVQCACDAGDLCIGACGDGVPGIDGRMRSGGSVRWCEYGMSGEYAIACGDSMQAGGWDLRCARGVQWGERGMSCGWVFGGWDFVQAGGGYLRCSRGLFGCWAELSRGWRIGGGRGMPAFGRALRCAGKLQWL